MATWRDAGLRYSHCFRVRRAPDESMSILSVPTVSQAEMFWDDPPMVRRRSRHWPAQGQNVIDLKFASKSPLSPVAHLVTADVNVSTGLPSVRRAQPARIALPLTVADANQVFCLAVSPHSVCLGGSPEEAVGPAETRR